MIDSSLIKHKSLVIKYYKKLDLNEIQMTIILLAMELSDYKFTLSSKNFAEYMTIDETEISDQLDILLSEGYINFIKKGKKQILDLSNIFNKIFIIMENENYSNPDTKYKILEKIFGDKFDDDALLELRELENKGVTIQDLLNSIREYDPQNPYQLFYHVRKQIKSNKSEANKIDLFSLNWINEETSD